MDEELKYAFSKDKLPESFSYPLKRSLLDSALNNWRVGSAVYSVRYLYGRGRAPFVLDVLFSPEGVKAHPSVSGRSLITVWAVRKDERKSCEQILVAEGLPILCQWLARACQEGNVWRSMGHQLSFSFAEGLLKHDDN
jgi:hypothetical protein